MNDSGSWLIFRVLQTPGLRNKTQSQGLYAKRSPETMSASSLFTMSRCEDIEGEGDCLPSDRD